MCPDKANGFVWGALALTLQVSRLVGAAPLKMTRERSGWRISVSPPLCLYSYFVLFVLHACILGGLILDLTLGNDRKVRTRTLFVTLTWSAELAFTLTITTLGVLGSRTRMYQIIEYLNIIEKIHVKSNNVDADSSIGKKRYIGAVVCLVLVNVQHLADCYLSLCVTITEGRSVLVVCLYACHSIEFLITVLLEMQFVFFALLINSTLKFINDSLENIHLQIIMNTSTSVLEMLNTNTIFSVKPSNILIDNLIISDKTAEVIAKDNIDNRKNIDGSNANMITIEKARQKVQQVSLSFGAICDIINQVNENYGTILFLLIGSFFLHLVETPYYFVIFVFTPYPELRLYRLVLQFSYCVLHFSYLILAVEPGHRAEREMDRTEVLISKLLRRVSSNDRLAQELDLFYKQIALSSVSYTPLGICTLNRPLITAMCGGVTTYLVIIFQFQALDHLKS